MPSPRSSGLPWGKSGCVAPTFGAQRKNHSFLFPLNAQRSRPTLGYESEKELSKEKGLNCWILRAANLKHAYGKCNGPGFILPQSRAGPWLLPSRPSASPLFASLAALLTEASPGFNPRIVPFPGRERAREGRRGNGIVPGIAVCAAGLWPLLGFCRGAVTCRLVFPFTRMDNFSRLFAVSQSSTHKSVNLKGPFHSFIVNICQCSGAVIAVTGESGARRWHPNPTDWGTREPPGPTPGMRHPTVAVLREGTGRIGARLPGHPRGGGGGRRCVRTAGRSGPAAPHLSTPLAPRRVPAGSGNPSPLSCPLFNFHAAF